MAAVADKQIDIILPQSKKPVAIEVMEFLEGLSERDKRDFHNFLQGAKFVMALNSKDVT